MEDYNYPVINTLNGTFESPEEGGMNFTVEDIEQMTLEDIRRILHQGSFALCRNESYQNFPLCQDTFLKKDVSKFN